MAARDGSGGMSGAPRTADKVERHGSKNNPLILANAGMSG